MSKTDPLSLKFSSLLDVFHVIIKSDPEPEKVKTQLSELKEKARISPELTVRQQEAIYGRCNNYMTGDYGKTKVDSNFGHTKSS